MNFPHFVLFLLLSILTSSNGRTFYSSYQHSMICNCSDSIVVVNSIQHIQTTILRAKAENKTVKAFGHLHSITDIICTDGIPISMENFINVTINKDRMTVTGQAGAALDIVAKALDVEGYALESMPLYRGITIGGSTGCGSHAGSLSHVNTISDQLVSMTFVDGLGNIRVINDEETLQKTRVHLGLLGVLVEAELRIVKKFNIAFTTLRMPGGAVMDGRMVNAARNSDFSMFIWQPNKTQVAFFLGNITQDEGNDQSNILGPANPLVWKTIKPVLEFTQATNNYELYKIYEIQQFEAYVGDPAFAYPIPPYLGPNGIFPKFGKATGNSYKMLGTYCKLEDSETSKCMWEGDEEWSIYNLNPSVAILVEKLPQFFELYKNISDKYSIGFGGLGGILFRFAPKSTTLMALENMGETVHIEFFPIRRTDPYKDPMMFLNSYQALIQLMITNLNGRPHWAKAGPIHHNYKNVNNNMGVNLTTFIGLMNDFDPNNIFGNDFKKRIATPNSMKVTLTSDVIHCALEDNCYCSQSNTQACATNQFCESYQSAFICSNNS